MTCEVLPLLVPHDYEHLEFLFLLFELLGDLCDGELFGALSYRLKKAKPVLNILNEIFYVLVTTTWHF